MASSIGWSKDGGWDKGESDVTKDWWRGWWVQPEHNAPTTAPESAGQGARRQSPAVAAALEIVEERRNQQGPSRDWANFSSKGANAGGKGASSSKGERRRQGRKLQQRIRAGERWTGQGGGKRGQSGRGPGCLSSAGAPPGGQPAGLAGRQEVGLRGVPPEPRAGAV